MSFLNEFISQYGMMILYAALTAIAGFLGTQVKKTYEKYITDKTKKDVVETCVKAVEQIYKDLKGEEKREKAIESIVDMLSEKGITITTLEIELLIEATVAEFNKNRKADGKNVDNSRGMA